MSNVSAEEVKAIADQIAPEGAAIRNAVVAPRNFSEPQRLGAERQATLRKTLKKALPELSRAFTVWLRRPVEIDLVDVGEIDATTLFDATEAPYCVLSFTTATRSAAKSAGWLVWELGAATVAAEVALGGDLPAAPRTSALSDIERSIVAEVLTDGAAKLAPVLGLAVSDARLLQDDDELVLLTEEAEVGDTQRLSVHLTVRGLGESESTLRLYLPGVVGDEPANAHPPAPLPRHLGPVPVELSAHLGSVEIGLADLLALEVGDVISLGVEVGSPVSIRVEDRVCGTALWGRKSGNLVLRIQELGGATDEDL